MDDPKLLTEQADRAAAGGDPAAARDLLTRAVLAAPEDFELRLKLAATARMSGDQPAALAAVEQALALRPLDFMALLMRANLLEKLARPGAGEAYGHALAQKPADLPPQLAALVAHAEARHGAQVAERTAALTGAMAGAAATATAEEQGRFDRFRSNAVRATRPYHSDPTHYHYPGLVEREFHDRATMPWLAELEAATDVIAEDFARVAAAERAEVVPYIQYADHEPLAQWRALNHSRDWSAIHLWQNGRLIEANARHCAATLAVLARLPQPAIGGCSPNAMFSLLAPHTTIPPHTGVANTRLVCHLPLVVPPGCWFRVGAERRDWRRGEAFVFDDTIEHEAANPSDQLRVVFIFDVWHPGLSEAERAGVTALLEADGAGAGAL